MSLGDEPGYGDASRGEDGGYGGSGQTRTRLPDRPGDVYGGARRRGSSSRSLITVVGVVVLLIAAIAFANRGDDSPSSGGEDGDKAKTSPTAASGDHPVDSKVAGIPSGFPHTGEGAQSAAANYAVALGSADMFDKAYRDQILATVITSSRVTDFEATLDKAYTPQFNKNVGLNEDGSTPQGYTFVSRTSPIGTKTTKSSNDTATVEVWCSGLLGLAERELHQPGHQQLVHHHHEVGVGRRRLEDRHALPEGRPSARPGRRPGLQRRRHREGCRGVRRVHVCPLTAAYSN